MNSKLVIAAVLMIVVPAYIALDCQPQQGLCFNVNGVDTNVGQTFIKDVDGSSTEERQAACLAACLEFSGATGCELVNNVGCWVHNVEANIGVAGEQDNAVCWILKRCGFDLVSQPEQGLCLDVGGVDTNVGQTYLQDVEGSDEEKRAACLAACIAQEGGVSGCELVNGVSCWVHNVEANIGTASNAENGICWILSGSYWRVPTTTTKATTTTTKATTTSTEKPTVCENKSTKCNLPSRWAKKPSKFCAKKWVQKKCPVLCGLCPLPESAYRPIDA
jgi:hypothetical protein